MFHPLRRTTARFASLAIALFLSASVIDARGGEPIDWEWLVPLDLPIKLKPADPQVVHRLPQSAESYREPQLRDLKHAVDWYPGAHPSMPAIVSTGHDDANACGFCHLPTGSGRPENSPIAGLPADYIIRQVAAFAEGSRKGAAPVKIPVQMMTATAKAVTTREVAAAADYFSKLPFKSHVRVVETAQAGFKRGLLIYVLDPENVQPVGERIIEAPVDLERFEERDPFIRFIAYVPPGSIAAGRALAATGGPAALPCESCHGAGLKGGAAPPLAGRSPTVLVRALAAFHEGARSNAEAAPMREVTSKLDTKMMISLAAYAASLEP